MQNNNPQKCVGTSILKVPDRYRKRITIDEVGCWLWTGARHRQGYGMVTICGKVTTAHRFVFELLIGPIPKGFNLHHKCEVPACCNPDHLAVLNPLDHRRAHWRTHCLRGHELTPANTILGRNGLRQCRNCKNESRRKWDLEHPGYGNPYKRAYKLRKKLSCGLG